jgi:hypothetical protein
VTFNATEEGQERKAKWEKSYFCRRKISVLCMLEVKMLTYEEQNCMNKNMVHIPIWKK